MGRGKHREGYHRGGKWQFAGNLRKYGSALLDDETESLAPPRGDDFSDVKIACAEWLTKHSPSYALMRSFRFGHRGE